MTKCYENKKRERELLPYNISQMMKMNASATARHYLFCVLWKEEENLLKLHKAIGTKYTPSHIDFILSIRSKQKSLIYYQNILILLLIYLLDSSSWIVEYIL